MALVILVFIKKCIAGELGYWLAQAKSEEYTEMGRRAEWKERDRVLLVFYHTGLLS